MKIKFIKAHNGHVDGDVIEVTDARAKYLVMVKVAEYADGSQLTKKKPAKTAKPKKASRAKTEKKSDAVKNKAEKKPVINLDITMSDIEAKK